MKVTLNTNNFNTYQNQQNKRPVFKGAYNSLTDKMAQGFANVAKKQGTVKFVDWMAKNDAIRILTAATGVVISGFYLYNTSKSKKIEQEQKKPLMVNMALVTALATTTGWFTDKAIKDKIDAFEEYFDKKNTAKKMDPKLLDICKKGVRPASTLLIFTALYRYISPVVVTPIANKISNTFFAKENSSKKA